MKTFTYQNQGTNTYLVYELTEEDKVDTVTLGMITNNKIGHFIPAIYTQMDNIGYVKYNVSSKISLKQFYGGIVNQKRLLTTFKSIVSAFLETEEYMIDSNSIVLDMDYIFVDVTTSEAEVVCVPVIDVLSKKTDMLTFFKNIIFSINFEQSENCNYVTQIINYLNNSGSFSISGFKQLLDSIDSGHSNVSNSKQEFNFNNNYEGNTSNYTAPSTPNMSATATYQSADKLEETKTNAAFNTAVNMKQPQNVGMNIPQTKNTFNSTNNVAQKPSGQMNTNFAIPGKDKNDKVKLDKTVPNNAEQDNNEKPMSMMYLLQHYNKENAALYKAQKNAKKSNGSSDKNTNNNSPYAVPGQQSIPQTNIPQNQAQSIPVNQPTPPQQAVYQNNTAPQSFQMPNNSNPQMIYNIDNSNQGSQVNFGETTVLGASASFGETTVLSPDTSVKQNPYLIRKKNNEKIAVNKPNFRIGKEKSFVDCFIGDNTAISRNHAIIIVRDNSYFIVDTNSLNHTFVNGTMIQSNVEIPIASGDKITLANEEFEFVLC